jgi:histidinol dehydrogenase
VSDFTKATEEKVKRIVERVRKEGDKALFYYSKKFDKVELKELKASEKRLEKAFENLSAQERNALRLAAKNIAFFARKQLPKPWKIKKNGILLGEVIKPIDCIGVYVPAGRFPLVSSVLMNAIPAKVAGVKRIVLCTPPKASEKVLAAAYMLGIKEVFLVGGAQAIAAMAFGTETIPKVDKIVGPGNVFVSTAKRLLYGTVGIDMPAGPSEVLVFSDRGRIDWIAAELKAQAEHDEKARAVFVTTKQKLAMEVRKETKEIANIEIVRARSAKLAIELINETAPEHLVLFDGREMLPKIRNAGSIFLGKYSAVAFGDYCSGSNHVLPTAGFAKARAGLSARDFVKVIAFQKVSGKGAKRLAKIGERIAEMEGMRQHKKSMEIRKRKMKTEKCTKIRRRKNETEK